LKVLLDENVPHPLRHRLPSHGVYTVAYLRWQGATNGALLRRAAAERFEAFDSCDRGLETEQNVKKLPLPVVLLRSKTNTMVGITPLVPALIETLKRPLKRELVVLREDAIN
jgi:hypothetical protein